MAGQILTPDQIAAREAMSTEGQSALVIVQNLAPLLVGISNQLDLLIQLECGFLKREEMRKRFSDFKRAQQIAEAEAAGAEAVAASEEETEGGE